MNDELKHYGVKGMKWGVHRFQKKDGTLTSAGKKRHFEKNDELYSKGKVLSNAKSGPYKENEYVKERKRQPKHIAMKRAIDIGSRFVNSYTKQHDVTLNGKHVGIPDNVKTFVNMLLDYKYMKDTFK